MENELIILDDGGRISTALIADGFGRRHERISYLIRKYKSEFEELGGIVMAPKIHGKGRPTQGILLNEGQTMFLSSLLKSSKTSLMFKKELCKSFNSAKNLLSKLKTALESFDFDDIECRYVYAAQDEKGNLKIGISNNPERRLKELNACNAGNLELVYLKETSLPRYQNETLLHGAAEQYHIGGEWFTEEAMEVLN